MATTATATDQRKPSAKEYDVVIMQLPSVQMVAEDITFPNEREPQLDADGLPKCWLRVPSPFVKRMKKLQRQKSARTTTYEPDSGRTAMCLQPQSVAEQDKADSAVRPVSAVRVAGVGPVKPAVRKFPARGFYSLDSQRAPNKSSNSKPVRVSVPAEFWDEFTQDFCYEKKTKAKLHANADEDAVPAGRKVQFSRPTSGRLPSQRNLIDDFQPPTLSRPVSAAPSARAPSARAPSLANVTLSSFTNCKVIKQPSNYLDTVQNKFSRIYRNSGATSHNNDLVIVVPPLATSPDYCPPTTSSRVPVATYSERHSPRHSFVHVPLSHDERSEVNDLLQSSYLRHIRPLTVHRRPKSALKQDVEYLAFWRGRPSAEADYYYQ